MSTRETTYSRFGRPKVRLGDDERAHATTVLLALPSLTGNLWTHREVERLAHSDEFFDAKFIEQARVLVQQMADECYEQADPDHFVREGFAGVPEQTLHALVALRRRQAESADSLVAALDRMLDRLTGADH